MAISFNGSTDFLNAGDVLDMATGTAFTIMGWVVRGATGVRHEIFSKETGTTGYELCIRETNFAEFGAFNGAFTVATGTTTIAAGTLFHICGVYDPSGGNLLLYVNGTLEGTTPTGSTSSVNAANLNIGRRPDSTRYFNGSMEDLRVYNRALPVGEVQTIVAARGRDRIVHGLLARWPMTGVAPGAGNTTIYNIQTTDSITTATSLTLSYTVPASLTSPVLVVCAGAEATTVANSEPTTATFGATSMTKHVSVNTTLTAGAGSAIFSVATTSGSSQTITVNYTGSCTPRSMIAFVVSNALSSVNASGSGFANSGTATASLTTTQAGKLGITHCHTGDTQASNGVTGTGHAELSEIISAGGGCGGRIGSFDATAIQTYSGYGYTFPAAQLRTAITMVALDTLAVSNIPDVSGSGFALTLSGGPSYLENIALECAA